MTEEYPAPPMAKATLGLPAPVTILAGKMVGEIEGAGTDILYEFAGFVVLLV
jgi:hypothetical protein